MTLAPTAAPSYADEAFVVDPEPEALASAQEQVPDVLSAPGPAAPADADVITAEAAEPVQEVASPAVDLDLPSRYDEPVPSDLHSEPGDVPSFVRSADRAARWRSPRMRAALVAGCAVAGVSLLAQWGVAQRDLLAARLPAAHGPLATACALIGCELHAPRALEALRVESSGVVRIEKGNLYRLTVALRNLERHEVALPAFELSLTDTRGQLIARRVVRAVEFGVRAESIGSGAELMLQATIQVGTGTVAGYTIELFYP